jgi:hypothetical protein
MPRAVQEQERARVMPETRRDEAAAPGRTHSAPDAAPQRERVDLPGKPANRMYRGQDNKESGERRRSWQKSDN